MTILATGAGWHGRSLAAAEAPVIGQYGILTPKPLPEPRVNGARVFGVRPGRPFLFTIAATGDRPMTFAATNLPAGLALDEKTGRITGVLAKEGEHAATLVARNSAGAAERPLKIVVGDRIALTPPMGWNSWNCWAESVDEAKIRAAAEAMVSTGLANHGWTYINIHDCWPGPGSGAGSPTRGAPPETSPTWAFAASAASATSGGRRTSGSSRTGSRRRSWFTAWCSCGSILWRNLEPCRPGRSPGREMKSIEAGAQPRPT